MMTSSDKEESYKKREREREREREKKKKMRKEEAYLMRDHSDPTTGLGADVNINTRRKEERRGRKKEW